MEEIEKHIEYERKRKKKKKYGDVGIMGVIAEEDVVAGFVLAGVGEELEKPGTVNFFCVNPRTADLEIVEAFRLMDVNPYIKLIVINESSEKRIKSVVSMARDRNRVIVTIPDKGGVIDMANDDVVRRAKNKMDIWEE